MAVGLDVYLASHHDKCCDNRSRRLPASYTMLPASLGGLSPDPVVFLESFWQGHFRQEHSSVFLP